MVRFSLYVGSAVLIALTASAHPLEPRDVDYPMPVGCNAVGDCHTDTVKWGHPASTTGSYLFAVYGTSIKDFLSQAQKDADRDGSQNVPQSYTFPPQALIPTYQVKFSLQMYGSNTVTWADLHAELGYLVTCASAIIGDSSGIVWNKDHADQKLGMWTLKMVGES